jgi:hypothetical protein
MIHISDVHKMLTNPKTEFSCRVWKSNGEIMNCRNVVCTSSYFAENTATLLFTESRQIRKIRLIAMFELNDEEIYI